MTVFRTVSRLRCERNDNRLIRGRDTESDGATETRRAIIISSDRVGVHLKNINDPVGARMGRRAFFSEAFYPQIDIAIVCHGLSTLLHNYVSISLDHGFIIVECECTKLYD